HIAVRLTPRSPLFPYTTLFRSGRFPHVKQRFLVSRGTLDRRVHRADDLEAERAASGLDFPDRLPPLRRISHHASLSDVPWAELEDRKSTRLNSSHVKISYAVFC